MSKRRSSVKGTVTDSDNPNNLTHKKNTSSHHILDSDNGISANHDIDNDPNTVKSVADATPSDFSHTDFVMPGSLDMHHIMTLAFLLSKGAHSHYVETTTIMLGRAIQKSQQSASRHLADLEQHGFIERGPAGSGRNMSIKVTPSGFKEIELLSSILNNSLNTTTVGFEKKMIHGVLVSGMGEGAYYMALDGYTRQFRTVIGYVPFPGTLNIRLWRSSDKDLVRRLVTSTRAERIVESFSDGKRTYGWVKCFPALLHVCGDDDDDLPKTHTRNYNNDHTHNTDSSRIPDVGGTRNGLLCELIILERTHHDKSIVELVSPMCLRDAASISDGSKVIIEILPSARS